MIWVYEKVVGEHTRGAKRWRGGIERAPMTCLIAPPPGPPSARHGRGRDKSGPYALFQQLFHTPQGCNTFHSGNCKAQHTCCKEGIRIVNDNRREIFAEVTVQVSLLQDSPLPAAVRKYLVVLQ